MAYRSTLNVSGPSFRLVEIVWRFSAFVKSERVAAEEAWTNRHDPVAATIDHTHHDAPGRRPHIA